MSLGNGESFWDCVDFIMVLGFFTLQAGSLNFRSYCPNPTSKDTSAAHFKPSPVAWFVVFVNLGGRMYGTCQICVYVDMNIHTIQTAYT